MVMDVKQLRRERAAMVREIKRILKQVVPQFEMFLTRSCHWHIVNGDGR